MNVWHTTQFTKQHSANRMPPSFRTEISGVSLMHGKCYLLTAGQAGWFLRPNCAPSSEPPQHRMPPVRNRGIMRMQHFWVRTSVVDCRCTPSAMPQILPRHATIDGRLPEWQASKCISSASFVRIESNFFTIHRRHRRKKWWTRILKFELWFLRIFLKFSKRRRPVPLRPIWTIRVAAKLDQTRVLVTKFHQNRLTTKGRSAGQRHTDRQTDTLGWK